MCHAHTAQVDVLKYVQLTSAESGPAWCPEWSGSLKYKVMN